MKFRIEVDCTPEEARTAMGLPDVTALNEQMMSEVSARLKANMAALAPDELVKTWFALGGQAQEQFRKLLSAAAGAKG